VRFLCFVERLNPVLPFGASLTSLLRKKQTHDGEMTARLNSSLVLAVE